MYPTERQDALLRALSQKGFISIRDLAVQFDVSEITIRRDLKVLKQKGLVEKVVGGGQVVGSAQEPTFLNKRVLKQEEKQAIAAKAMSLFESGMTIGIGAGTTTWTVAKSLDKSTYSNLTFVTNSTNVALELKANGWDDIHLTGGHFRTPSDALVGPLAESVVKRLHTDLLLLGAHGVDLVYGVSTPNLQEASMNRVLMENTDKIALLFDDSKWGVRALAQIAQLDEIDTVVTNMDSRENELTELRHLGVEVLTATETTRRSR